MFWKSRTNIVSVSSTDTQIQRYRDGGWEAREGGGTKEGRTKREDRKERERTPCLFRYFDNEVLASFPYTQTHYLSLSLLPISQRSACPVTLTSYSTLPPVPIPGISVVDYGASIA